MSRIDDSDRQAQRAAERLALEKRQAEDRAKKLQQGESAFAKRVQQSQTQQGTAQDHLRQLYGQAQSEHTHEDKTEAGSIVGEAILLATDGESKEANSQAKSRLGARTFTDKLKQSRAGEGERASEGRIADEGQQSLAAQGRGSDARTSDMRTDSRRSDAKTGRDALSERGESSLKSSGGAQSASAGGARGKGELKSGDEGGQKGGGQKDQQGGSTNLGGGFRFNPALMAPVPVARPRENSVSERLRQIANEIAQKIVERVRVGTNASGAAEFQIDLRSNVLSGLSIKVSGGKGKIKLVFSGTDKEVLKALGESAEGLKQALNGRGLKLDELRIEERA